MQKKSNPSERSTFQGDLLLGNVASVPRPPLCKVNLRTRKGCCSSDGGWIRENRKQAHVPPSLLSGGGRGARLHGPYLYHTVCKSRRARRHFFLGITDRPLAQVSSLLCQVPCLAHFGEAHSCNPIFFAVNNISRLPNVAFVIFLPSSSKVN